LDGEVADTGRHTSSRKSSRSETVEVVTRGERRRSWSVEQKRMIVVEAMQPGAKAAEVIRRWGISSGLFYDWRRQMLAGELGALPMPMPMPLPAFAEVAVAEEAPMLPPAPEIPARRPVRLEVVLPCGTVLRLDEDVGADALRRVLAVLRGR
jgi:transposase